MIIPRILGGLGNQLFSYAAVRRLALGKNSGLAIDHISGFARDFTYQRHYQLDHFNIPCRKATATERLEPFSRIRRNLLRRWNARRSLEQRRYIQQQGADFDSRLLTLRPSSTLYLEGYWQSVGYFKDIDPQIREGLPLILPKDNVNHQMAIRIMGCF